MKDTTTSKWYPDLQEKKFAETLIHAYLRSGKSSRGSMPKLFSLYLDSLKLFPKLLQVNDEVFTGLIKK